MKKFRLAGLIFLGFLAGPAAFAADTPSSSDAPDLTKVRAMIKAKDFKGALVDLNALVNSGVQHADVYNLIGFSYRKSGDQKQGMTFYNKALDFDPDHKGALEYQGQLFIEMGQPVKAQYNLAKLKALCPTGCEEREDLEKALAAAPKTN